MKRNDLLSKSLEILVAIMILLPLIFSVFCFTLFWFSLDQYHFFISVFSFSYLPLVAILICITLILWITIGNGINSKLWVWLPPFVMFKGMGSSGRVLVVIVLVIGTLVGLFGELSGFIEPIF